MMNIPLPAATILGYPRIGPNRELKTALEQFWAGQLDSDDFFEATAELYQSNWRRQIDLGLKKDDSSVPLDFFVYDPMLAMTVAVDALPERFEYLRADTGQVSLERFFVLARGVGSRSPLEMTKWFDSNYHYLVPEIGPDTRLGPTCDLLRHQISQSQKQGIKGRPVLPGPVTFLLLAKAAPGSPEGFSPLDRLDELVEIYAGMLGAFADNSIEWVQLDEPALVVDTWDIDRRQLLARLQRTYQRLSSAQWSPQLLVTLPYGQAGDAAVTLAESGVEAIALDLVKGDLPSKEQLTAIGKTGVSVAAGVVSGRNIWRTNLDQALEKLRALRQGLGAQCRIGVSTSTSLQHVPHDVSRETELDPQLVSWLAFADQKIIEVATLARALNEGEEAVSDQLAKDRQTRAERAAHAGVNRLEVRAAVAAVTDGDRKRLPYAQRKSLQDKALGLPVLPTTSIGSFPQTVEIRKARAALRAGRITQEEYVAAMQAEIGHVVAVQERLGMDVLVHGEPERNDMVQYFAENLDGFATTKHGWVQSYGSRCTRPSILWGDVSRAAAITVQWSTYAQSLTNRPMKGMLTGPVTILAWSFVRDDLAWGQVADQVALALRAEIADLERGGIAVIQVDEPALRELLPLRRSEQEEYLEWSVGSFLLATAGAKAQTQIHTHLCYSEFNVVMDAIDRLDADVTSIEASRSRMEILPAVGQHGFERQIGPGVWDIHSPRVPSVEEQTQLLRAAVTGVGADKVWVNPDCGLKTRAYAETLPSLENLVEAAKIVRAELADIR